jgi:serine/threonine protein kinase/Tfp pilus assembly protein PilF
MIGQTLSHYRITEKLGAGGMGEVYKAHDERLDRDVAIKVLRGALAADPERLRRFEQEARAASALNHPNIVTIYDIGKHGTTSYIAMEYVEGKTLRELVNEGPLPKEKLLRVATQIAEGLAKAHGAGIIHRDLKPENLMVTNDGYVKILDFGLAKLLPQPGPDSDAATITKEGTVAGAVMGTASYMSPEQALGQPLDARTDVFSLGSVLYEMATGRRPFQGETAVALFDAILHKAPASPHSSNPELPSDFDGIIGRALEKDPGKRYSSAKELLEGLNNVRLDSALPQVEDQKSIVVLPFENMSPDPDQEYFCDGITEEIINALAHIKSLRVVARTSAFAFKGKHQDIREIGRKLNVETVLEGSVRKAGDRLRITAQLITISDGYHLWSERYDRKLEDVFAIQDEIASTISRKLAKELLRADEAALVPRPTENLDAYDLYCRGLYVWNKRDAEGLNRAVQYFLEATRIDPSFANAYVGLANTYTTLAVFFARPLELIPKAKAAAAKALELDDNLADAHASYAQIAINFDWDWKAGERGFQRALELKPSYAMAHMWYAELLTVLGRHEEALLEITRALELDPLPLAISNMKGWLLYHARRYDEAIWQLQKVLELDPKFYNAHICLPWVCADAGRYEDAIRCAKRAVEVTGRDQIALSSLGYAYGRIGQRQDALAVIKELEERSDREPVHFTVIAWVYIGLGDRDKAFEYLEKAFSEREEILVWMKVGPFCDGLRSDPRFGVLLHRMNFPD